MSTNFRRAFSLAVDTATPTPHATSLATSRATSITTSIATSTATSTATASTNTLYTSITPTTSSNACSTNSDCIGDGICSDGTCNGINQAAPFAPAGSLGAEPTSHLDRGTAIGIGVGVTLLIILMIGAGFLYFRFRRRRQQPSFSPEAPPTARNRSASTATKWTIDNDQKTLVASLPNSPQHAAFAAQTPNFPAEFYTSPGKVLEEEEKDVAEYRRQGGTDQATSPVDKALPLPPTEEKRYAVNVNINKSMIFDDAAFSAAAYAPSPVMTPQERAPRYRFEEYLPPVPANNPRISITRTKSRASSTISSEYELENYPHGNGYVGSGRTSMSDIDEHDDPRDDALSKLEGTLALPELPPPSPSFSFRSYDWYQDIISGDQSAVEATFELPTTPYLPDRNPARGVNPLLANPPDHGMDPNFMPAPLSPAFPSPVASTHLHPSSARMSYMPSPTSPNFRLSPTVYQMPNSSPISKLVPSLPSTRPQSEASTIPRYSRRYSRYASWLPDDDLDIPEDELAPPRYLRYNSMVASIVEGSAAPTARTSARNSARYSRSQSAPRPQSAMTQKSHQSRSWLPEDGVYLPEEGTHDSFKVFKREMLASRPTSYSPLA